jgi:hypothetical protein
MLTRRPELPREVRWALSVLVAVLRDSAKDHPTVMDVLAAFIREHSREQWPLAPAGAAAPTRTTRPDVQAAAAVIGRRADLGSAEFNGANLTGADFAGATLLTGALFTGADLSGAIFTGANLKGAHFYRANLTGADLAEADLAGADFKEADLTRAKWPADVAVPARWERDLNRLKRL